MLPVELSLLELAPVQPSEAPVRFAYEKWVAAGKPCLRQSCGHPHADHIPSGAMECDQCDCARFVGLTHPDDCRCGRRHHHHRLQRPVAHLPERRSNESPLLRRSRPRGCMGSSDQTCMARMCRQRRCDRPVQPQAGVVMRFSARRGQSPTSTIWMRMLSRSASMGRRCRDQHCSNIRGITNW
jgi:hypothetical protein